METTREKLKTNPDDLKERLGDLEDIINEAELRAKMSNPGATFTAAEVMELCRGYLEAHRITRELQLWIDQYGDEDTVILRRLQRILKGDS